MSMDDQYIEMQKFHRSIISFNEQLRDSFAALEFQHENVAPHWQDEMRKHYDSIWDPFKSTMKRYIESEGPGYIQFLEIKLQSLRRYLYGD